MLSPLQQQLLELISGLPEAGRFALAGGGALIIHGAIDRRTRDLDLFADAEGMDGGEIRRALSAIERALAADGSAWTREATTGSFARLVVVAEDEECRIDLAADARIRAADQVGGIPLLSLEELAADKVLALFGRAAARDFRDVAALRRLFTWGELLALAAEKDPGFSVTRFLEAVRAFDRLDAEEFDVAASELDVLREQVSAWLAEIPEAVEDGA